MTVYDLITDYKMPLIMLTRAGYVDKRMARDLKIYKEHLEGKTVKEIAEEQRITEQHIYRIIKKLKKVV